MVGGTRTLHAERRRNHTARRREHSCARMFKSRVSAWQGVMTTLLPRYRQQCIAAGGMRTCTTCMPIYRTHVCPYTEHMHAHIQNTLRTRHFAPSSAHGMAPDIAIMKDEDARRCGAPRECEQKRNVHTPYLPRQLVRTLVSATPNPTITAAGWCRAPAMPLEPLKPGRNVCCKSVRLIRHRVATVT